MKRILSIALLVSLASVGKAQLVPFDYSPFGNFTVVECDYLEHWQDGSGLRNGPIHTFGGWNFKVPASEVKGSFMGGGGFASADLVDGTLKAHAWGGPSGTGYDDEAQMGYTTQTDSRAAAFLWDTVTLGGGAPDPRIPIRLAVDGFASPNGSITAGLYIQPKGQAQSDMENWLFRTEKGFQGEFDLDAEILWPLVPTEFEVIALLMVDAPSDHFADFSHTAHFQWDLPSGMTYSSASGVFNPGKIQAVPEPGAFIALGLGAATLLRRRRRTHLL